MDSGMYGKYMMIYDEIYNGGKYESDLERPWRTPSVPPWKGVSEANVESDADVIKAQQALDEYDTVRADEIRDAIDNAWRNDAQTLVDYTIENYSGTIACARRTPARKCSAIPACRWHIRCSTAASASLTITAGLPRTAERRDLTTTFPTAEDLYNEMYDAYDGDVAQYWSIEGIGRADMLSPRCRNSRARMGATGR